MVNTAKFIGLREFKTYFRIDWFIINKKNTKYGNKRIKYENIRYYRYCPQKDFDSGCILKCIKMQ